MRHKVKKTVLNIPRGHRRLLIKNLATSLVIHEKIKTTEARAKALRPIIDKLINSAKKKNKVIAIREVNAVLQNELSAKKLIDQVAKKYDNKTSGYTRITKLGVRAGDAAPLVQIELT